MIKANSQLEKNDNEINTMWVIYIMYYSEIIGFIAVFQTRKSIFA